MKGTALTKRQALTQYLQIAPTNDQIQSLAELQKVIHKVEVSLGNNGLIAIRELAELLYIARLPKTFESIVEHFEMNNLDFQQNLVPMLREKSEKLKASKHHSSNPVNRVDHDPETTENTAPSPLPAPRPSIIWMDPAKHKCFGHSPVTCFIKSGVECPRCKAAGLRYQHPIDHVKACHTKTTEASATPNPAGLVKSDNLEAAMDSGCFANLGNNKSSFDFYSPSSSYISSCTGQSSEIIGKGKFPTFKGLGQVEAQHCPDLTSNLLSVRYFDKKGYSSVFGNGQIKLYPTNQI